MKKHTKTNDGKKRCIYSNKLIDGHEVIIAEYAQDYVEKQATKMKGFKIAFAVVIFLITIILAINAVKGQETIGNETIIINPVTIEPIPIIDNITFNDNVINMETIQGNEIINQIQIEGIPINDYENIINNDLIQYGYMYVHIDNNVINRIYLIFI